jgi:23S rRNA-/tRNA-specific pseudouridylate synthase
MVVAKKRSALRAINELFAERKIEKYYLTVLSGVCRRKEIIDVPLAIVRHNGIRIAVADHKEGSACMTVFVPLSRHLGRSMCLVMPQTGRMHQIRSHAAYMDLPIVGDQVYKGDEAERLYLHSARLAFRYLDTDWTFEQSPPEFWNKEFFNGWDLWKTINKNKILQQ